MTNHHQPEVSLRTRAGLSLCYQEGRHHHHVRNVLLRKNAFFWSFSKLPPLPQFGQLVQLFTDVEIQDLKVSVG